ncbi:MAG TPA: hypothetical protein PKD27_01805 [Tepidiformaceae bacterium]|nr:hypothetical protein [Tepidiformaceae bacterium]
MSLDPPPGRPGTSPSNLTKPRTSDPGHPTGWRTDEVLLELATLWNTAPDGTTSNRWEAVKSLRVLRLAQYGNDSHTSDIPPRYFAAYRLNRLSEVARTLNATQLSAPHLDIDWFGNSKENWWTAGGTAKYEERRMTTALLSFLERSMGLSPSPGTATAKWSWPASFAPKPGGLRDGLERLGAVDQPAAVRFEWHRDQPALPFVFETNPTPLPSPPPAGSTFTLIIRTPTCRLSDFAPS